jgi:hypothetical protein
MIQEIITVLIILGAVVYSAYSLFRIFKPKKGKEKSMGCPGCDAGCSIPNHKNSIRV